MASHSDYKFRSGAAFVAAAVLGVAGSNLYQPSLDASQLGFSGILLGIATLCMSYAIRTAWRGARNRRAIRDRRRPVPGAFLPDRRLRDLGPFNGIERRQGPTERRFRDRRDRFA
jgi:hypothetical protein